MRVPFIARTGFSPASEPNPAARRRFWLTAVGIVCGLFALASLTIYSMFFARNPWHDWMVYYTAARAWLDGDLPVVYDGYRFTALINEQFVDWLSKQLPFHPFLYPPHYLLLLIPFGLLPFAAACMLFLAASLACFMLAVRLVAGNGYRRWLFPLSIIFAPATAFNIGSGQNAFLTGALIIGGFAFLPAYPRLAGVLLGLLSYKPQLWLLVPVALVAGRQWRTLASAVITAVIVIVASAAVFGVAPWLAWFDWFLNAPPDAYRTWLDAGRMHGQSIYTNLALLGASHGAASFGQSIASIGSAACVWWCYRRPMQDDLRLPVLLAAAVLGAPHVTNYDTVLLVVAATIVFANGLDHGFRPGGVIVPVAVWVIQLFNPPMVFRIGLITPLLTVLLIGSAIAAASPAFQRSSVQWKPSRKIPGCTPRGGLSRD
jgi:alpha-1,2-mannosyltransferase